jgi:multidrug efflux system outer membrane protein
MRRQTASATMLLGGLLAGCAVGPRYHAPQPDVPETWHQSATDGLAPGTADVQEWWHVFHDEQLASLIDRASAGNLDLRMAVLRIREARALRGVAAGALLPSLSGSGSYQRSRASANGPMGAGVQAPGRGARFAETVARGTATSLLGQRLGTIAPGAPGLTNSVASGLVGLVPARRELADADDMNLFTTGFDAAWEIDVFGGLRRGVEAADAELAAVVEDYRSVQVSLLAEVATAYFDLRALQSQIEATRRNIALQQHTLSLTQARLAADLTSELDVRLAQTNLATTESELPLLETGLTVTIYRLGVLLGTEPTALHDELVVARAIPEPPGAALVGVPADILRRRPDLRAAERRLAAQVARIGVATAELYPRFTLSGTLALQATDINHLTDGRSVMYGFGPAVRWNLFDGLRNVNRIAAQEAAAQRAYVAYEQAVLVALQEAESAMVAYKSEQERRDALLRATEAARQAVQLAEARYDDGLTDFQNVLDAQRSLVTLENAVAQSRGQIAVHLVALYKALGGGWSPERMPQAEHLVDHTGVLADPLGYFFSGGQAPLPWAADTDAGGDDQTPTTPEN